MLDPCTEGWDWFNGKGRLVIGWRRVDCALTQFATCDGGRVGLRANAGSAVRDGVGCVPLVAFPEAAVRPARPFGLAQRQQTEFQTKPSLHAALGVDLRKRLSTAQGEGRKSRGVTG